MDEPRRVPIVDKRASASPPASAAPPAAHETSRSGPDASASGLGVDGAYDDASTAPAYDEEASGASSTGGEEEKQDFLDDLKRLQADFDNYRKRMMREQAATAGRAKARLMEQMLPVLDAFDQALEHEDGPGGMELIYKQLRTTLEAEGLEEIPAEGVAFDPRVHDAVDSREEADAQEIVCRSVYRRGYRLGDQILRAAMVVVARPPESSEPDIPEAAEG